MKRFMPLAWYRGNIMQQRQNERARVWLNKMKPRSPSRRTLSCWHWASCSHFSTIAPMIYRAGYRNRSRWLGGQPYYTGLKEGYTLYNWQDLFTGRLAKVNLWTPLLNSGPAVRLFPVWAQFSTAVCSPIWSRGRTCAVKSISAPFLSSRISCPSGRWRSFGRICLIPTRHRHTSDGLLAALFGIRMPLWWCQGMFPSVMVLFSLHYAPFAYILIGGIFRNMDATLRKQRPSWVRRG